MYEQRRKEQFRAKIKADKDGTWLLISRNGGNQYNWTPLNHHEMKVIIEILEKELEEND